MEQRKALQIGKCTIWVITLTFSFFWGMVSSYAAGETLSSVTVSGPATVLESSSAAYKATANFSNGTTLDVTSSVATRWSEISSAAQVSSSGILTTNAVTSNRSFYLSCQYVFNGVRKTGRIYVTVMNGAAPVATLTNITLTGPQSVNEGSAGSFVAIATFSNGTTQNVTSSATWGENSSYATVNGGTLTAAQVTGNQPVTVTASYSTGGVTKTASIGTIILDAPAPTVTLSSLTVTGAGTVNENSTSNYVATATFSNGATQDVTSAASWSDNSAYAAISAGRLTTSQVDANQTAILAASYTSNSVTKIGQLSITIVNAAAPPPVSGSHASRFTSYEGTKTCLSCHRTQAVEVHNSEHYQWAGKLGAINDFCIYPDPNHIGKLTNVNGIQVDGGCGKCHVGKGAKPAPVTANPTDVQLENIDCLVCHAPKYKRTVDPTTKASFIPDESAMGMSIQEAAVDIQKTSRETCLNCHTKSGGGDNFKRGDIEEHHRNPTTRAFDVHMSPVSLSGGDMHCTQCHTVSGHKIAGKGVDLRVQEGTKPECSTCHTSAPHKATTTLTSNNATQLNNHAAKRVHCTTCHIPTFAKKAPTDMFRDWSAAGELNVTTGLYDPARTMQANVAPQYKFWDGNSTIYKFGTVANPAANGNVLMAGPTTASQAITGAKIYPFKVHTALQPIDTVTRYLLPLKIGLFYTQGDLVQAIPDGQRAVGWATNPYDFQRTERWMGLFHEVSPKENAVGYNNNCTACHGTTTPKVPLKPLGYTAKKSTSDLCNDCHSSKSYSFNAVHPRHTNEGYNCNSCHNFSRAQ